MPDTATNLKPSELRFDIRIEDYEGAPKAVGVFIHTKDEDHDLADNLGDWNVEGLPEYFDGCNASENYWHFTNGALDKIKSDLEAAGFTYVPLDSDMGEENEDEDRAPIINRGKLVHVGTIDVDAGSIWIGDGCYILKDKGEPRPKDLGENWHDICERFFERSGYNITQRLWQEHLRNARIAFYESDEAKPLLKKLNTIGQIENNKPTEAQYAVLQEISLAQSEFENQWVKDNPWNNADEAVAHDTGVANFTHDMGHGGMGLMMSTYYGDGSYPVYVEYGEDRKRPRRVVIDFDPGCPGDEEEY